MKNSRFKQIPRALTALLMISLLIGLCFAGTTAPQTVFVANADELTGALSAAASSGDVTIVYFAAGVSSITLASSTTVPGNVTIDLSAGGGTLRVPSGSALDVAGNITGGSVEVSGGTLLRAFGSSITATITTNAGGVVRGARILTLENLSATSTETITAISYSASSGTDTSSYVTRAVNAVLYVKMTGSNYSSYQTIETVLTNEGNLFRLGTKNTDTLSLTYPLTYGGLTGAKLSSLNPVSYTASDSAIQLNNPTKDGFVFAGWTCEQLGVTVPQEKLVIPEGTTGELTLIAMWAEAPAGGGMSGGTSVGGDTLSDEDAQDQQDDAADQQEEQTQQQSTRRTRTASSSTKVSFTSDVVANVPTVSGLQEDSDFPWVWAFAGLGALGIIAIVAAKLLNRTRG